MKKKGYYIGFTAGTIFGIIVAGLLFTLLLPPTHYQEATQAQYDTMFMTPINSN